MNPHHPPQAGQPAVVMRQVGRPGAKVDLPSDEGEGTCSRVTSLFDAVPQLAAEAEGSGSAKGRQGAGDEFSLGPYPGKINWGTRENSCSEIIAEDETYSTTDRIAIGEEGPACTAKAATRKLTPINLDVGIA